MLTTTLGAPLDRGTSSATTTGWCDGVTYVGWVVAVTLVLVGFGMLKRGKFLLGIVVVLIGLAVVPGTLLLT